MMLFLLASGCPLIHEEPDSRECLLDSDCFVKEGEYCHPRNKKKAEVGECRPFLDTGIPDLRQFDIRPPDTRRPDGTGTDADGAGHDGAADSFFDWKVSDALSDSGKDSVR